MLFISRWLIPEIQQGFPVTPTSRTVCSGYGCLLWVSLAVLLEELLALVICTCRSLLLSFCHICPLQPVCSTSHWGQRVGCLDPWHSNLKMTWGFRFILLWIFTNSRWIWDSTSDFNLGLSCFKITVKSKSAGYTEVCHSSRTVRIKTVGLIKRQPTTKTLALQENT